MRNIVKHGGLGIKRARKYWHASIARIAQYFTVFTNVINISQYFTEFHKNISRNIPEFFLDGISHISHDIYYDPFIVKYFVFYVVMYLIVFHSTSNNVYH